VIAKDQASNLIDSPKPDFDNSGDITIQPGSIYQKNEEDVVTYVNRVKILGNQILEGIQNFGKYPP